MAVAPTGSASSLQALQQYRQAQQSGERPQPSEQTTAQDRVSIRSKQSDPGVQTETVAQQPEQTQPSATTRRQEAVAAYQEAKRAAEQPSPPEKQTERTLKATQA